MQNEVLTIKRIIHALGYTVASVTTGTFLLFKGTVRVRGAKRLPQPVYTGHDLKEVLGTAILMNAGLVH